jgi:hypothetical protein
VLLPGTSSAGVADAVIKALSGALLLNTKDENYKAFFYLQVFVIYRHKCFSGKNTRTPNIPLLGQNHLCFRAITITSLCLNLDFIHLMIELRQQTLSAIVCRENF